MVARKIRVATKPLDHRKGIRYGRPGGCLRHATPRSMRLWQQGGPGDHGACCLVQAGCTKGHANIQVAARPIAVWPHSSRPQSRMSPRIAEDGAFRRTPYNKMFTGVITK